MTFHNFIKSLSIVKPSRSDSLSEGLSLSMYLTVQHSLVSQDDLAYASENLKQIPAVTSDKHLCTYTIYVCFCRGTLTQLTLWIDTALQVPFNIDY